jgi:predicted AlkP superfamily phosphohydrolase/phosphomutase
MDALNSLWFFQAAATVATWPAKQTTRMPFSTGLHSTIYIDYRTYAPHVKALPEDDLWNLLRYYGYAITIILCATCELELKREY